MRICSLLPGATDTLAALGVWQQVVGISHECDAIPTGSRPAVVVRAAVSSESSSSLAIDQSVRAARREGGALYHVDAGLLRGLAPDLIIAQALCEVCAVTPPQLETVLAELPARPRLLTLQPTCLADVLEDIVRVADAVNRPDEGRALVAALRARLAAVTARRLPASQRPAVVCLEWLDPLFSAGHWVPEMVDLAGGVEQLGRAGCPSEEITWDQVIAVDPDVLLLIPCGFGVERTQRELSSLTSRPGWRALRAVRTGRIYALDAHLLFSGPGPRLVEGVELLAEVLHDHTRARAGAMRLDVSPA